VYVLLYLWQEDPQQQPRHHLIVVHQPDEERISAASDIDDVQQLQPLGGKQNQ